MSEFGAQLKSYRLRCGRGRRFTQTQLGLTMGDYLGGAMICAARISNWERGEATILHTDRDILLALVKAFHRHGALVEPEEANKFLAAGQYAPLNATELEDISPLWLEKISATQQNAEVRDVGAKSLARLQPFLPPTLRDRVEQAPPARWSEICLDHLNRMLETVATYVPREVALRQIKEPQSAEEQVGGRFLEGTLLFTDISGFTKLSEYLRKQAGRAGAEEVMRIINDYLDVMLGVLYRHHGLLIKFGGDAMLCLFMGDQHGAVSAIQAAWEMKEIMATQFSEIEVLQEVLPLSMKVGNNSGLLYEAIAGSDIHLEYFLTGSAVERTAHAESAAQRGDIIISGDTLAYVTNLLEVEELGDRPGFFRLLGLNVVQTERALRPRWADIELWLNYVRDDLWAVVRRLESLTPHLPLGVLSELVKHPDMDHLDGQYRRVTVLFC